MARRAQRKRILILVENLPVPFDRRVWMEATTLRQAGYGVSVVCPKGTYRWYEEREGIRIYRYPLPSLGGIVGHVFEYGLCLPATFLLTCVVFLRDGFDVIQSANPPDFFFLIALVFRVFGKKFVFDHHDLVPEMCETRWSGWRRALMYHVCRAAEHATFRCADRVISTNESYREIALGRGGIVPEHVVVVRSGPSLRRFGAPLPAVAAPAARPYVVGYLGVMGPNDGLDYLLRAARHVVHELRRTDVRFVLIGSGDVYAQLVALSREWGLDEVVRFTGRIPDEDVIALLSDADVCVAPDPKDALNDVSTMNKIIEYMALGKPVVAFDLREARVSAGDAAVYARPNDPVELAQEIVGLLADPDRRARMAKVGRQRFESTLAWEHQERTLLALYCDLIGGPVERSAAA